MRSPILIMAVSIVAFVPSPVWAAQTFFEEAVRNLDTEKLAVVLIFGTGLIATLLWGVTAMIRAYRGSAIDAKELQAHLDDLEDRIEALERRPTQPALADTQLPQPAP